MQRYALHLFTLCILVLFASCSSNQTPDLSNAASSLHSKTGAVANLATANETNTRGEDINLSQFKDLARFSKSTISAEQLEGLQTIVAKKAAANAQEDKAAVAALFNTFLGAEKAEENMGITFSMSEEPIEDGIFVFTIDAQQSQNMEFEMFDEEGFGLSAQNTLDLDEGQNYKALNVTELNDGTYIFRLRNEEGAELLRKLEIKIKE